MGQTTHLETDWQINPFKTVKTNYLNKSYMMIKYILKVSVMLKQTLILLAILNPLSAYAVKDVVDTNIELVCTTSGYYADGQKIVGTGIEKISIEVKRINFRKDDPTKPPLWGSMSNIKIKSGSSQVEANLIKSEKSRIAFGYTNDLMTEGDSRTEFNIYEISLDSMTSRKTALTLFSKGSNSITSYDGKCKKQ